MRPCAVLLAMAALLTATAMPVSAHHNHRYWSNPYYGYNPNTWRRPIISQPYSYWGPPRYAQRWNTAYLPGRRVGWYQHRGWY